MYQSHRLAKSRIYHSTPLDLVNPDCLNLCVSWNENVTLHGKTGTKVIARSQHANTTRLASLMSRICAYLINITMQDTLALFRDI